MKTVTLQQARKVLEVIENLPSEQLQEVLEGGYISDLIQANFSQMNRDDFRKLCGLLPVGISRQVFKVMVDYTKSLEEMIEAGKYDCVNNNITSDHFPIKGSGEKEVEITLFHFNQTISSDDAITEMAKAGYRPALVEELLALGAAYKELQKQFAITGLGSVWRHPDGYRHVPYLYWYAAGRRLYLRWFEHAWPGDWRFAFARKVSC